MKKTASEVGRKFVNGLILAFLVMVVVLGALYSYLGWGRHIIDVDPAKLVAQSKKALAAVAGRDLKSTMTPPNYNSVLQPLEQMIRAARGKMDGASYDPLGDYEYIRARTEPVPPIADEAYRRAMSETTFLKTGTRFLELKGDACRYWAGALWNRLEAEHAKERDGTAYVPRVEDEKQLLSILKAGLDGAPENQYLWYLRALVERKSGGFAAAAEDLRKALDLDPGFIAAWNDLGLTLINLKQFDDAEAALVKAKDVAEQAYARAGTPPGGDYVTALMNLADFHDSLASYYRHEVQISPAKEDEEALRRHEKAAAEYAAETRKYTSYDPPAERALKGYQGE